MAKSDNQKLKMLYLVKIFQEETDDEHSLTMQQIIEKLKDYDVNADRKTLYTDFAELERFGYEICREKAGRNTYYHMGSRTFELAELKLLVDSVQAAKFITDRRSKNLIHKLESLASNYEARKLQRQVVIAGRVKSVNKTVYNAVDAIYTAIGEEKQISFHYFQWDAAGNQVLRRGGALYQVSPQCLMWDDEYYYLVAYDPEAEIIKHFRVDKMKDLTITDKPREGQEAFRSFDMAKYSKSLFGMFSGDPVTVSLLCDNDMAGVIIDRFGEDVPRIPHDDGTFTVHVRVIPGGPFFGWVFGLGGKVKITGPEKVVKQMQEETRKIAAQYLPDYLPDNLTD